MSAKFYANSATVMALSNGRPTLAMLQLLQDYERRIAELEARLDAVAALAGPAGGATVDAEARAAIDAIIAGAA